MSVRTAAHAPLGQLIHPLGPRHQLLLGLSLRPGEVGNQVRETEQLVGEHELTELLSPLGVGLQQLDEVVEALDRHHRRGYARLRAGASRIHNLRGAATITTAGRTAGHRHRAACGRWQRRPAPVSSRARLTWQGTVR